MSKRSPTRAMQQVSDAAPALPFETPSAGSSSSVPPRSEVQESVLDEDTSPATPYPRHTAAIPAIRAPDLTPSWAVNGEAERTREAEVDVESAHEDERVAPLHRSPEEVELEEYAAISASLDDRPEEREAILEQANIDEQGFAIIKGRWRSAISTTARRGDDTLMARFDSAYVARLDEERERPYDVSDYAYFCAASEMGRGDIALAEQGVPIAAKMILRRHWLRRIMAEEGTQRRYYDEVDRARG